MPQPLIPAVNVQHPPPPPPQPLPAIPPVHIDIQAAMDAAQQRDERWMQQMHNTQRNEQQAQQQLQQDEEEEEHCRWQQERELIRRQQRSEEVANNTSQQDLTIHEASNSQEQPVALIPTTPHQAIAPLIQPLHFNVVPPPPSVVVPGDDPFAVPAQVAPVNGPVQFNGHQYWHLPQKLTEALQNLAPFAPSGGQGRGHGQPHVLSAPPAPPGGQGLCYGHIPPQFNRLPQNLADAYAALQPLQPFQRQAPLPQTLIPAANVPPCSNDPALATAANVQPQYHHLPQNLANAICSSKTLANPSKTGCTSTHGYTGCYGCSSTA